MVKWQQDALPNQFVYFKAQKRLKVRYIAVIYRNKHLLELVRQSPCQACGNQDSTVCAAHSNQLRDGKGRGLKAHDFRIAALCFTCHSNLDQGAKMTKAERVEMFEEAHRATIGWLFENGHLEVK